MVILVNPMRFKPPAVRPACTRDAPPPPKPLRKAEHSNPPGGSPHAYQEEFCRDLFYASNTFGTRGGAQRGRLSLEEEQALNESAKCKIIGLTLEVRAARAEPCLEGVALLGRCSRSSSASGG